MITKLNEGLMQQCHLCQLPFGQYVLAIEGEPEVSLCRMCLSEKLIEVVTDNFRILVTAWRPRDGVQKVIIEGMGK